MRMFAIFIVTLCCCLAPVVSENYSEPQTLQICHPGRGRGFFSVMDHVFGNLYHYKNQDPEVVYQGFTIDFGVKGLIMTRK